MLNFSRSALFYMKLGKSRTDVSRTVFFRISILKTFLKTHREAVASEPCIGKFAGRSSFPGGGGVL